MTASGPAASQAGDALWQALVKSAPFYVALISLDRRAVFLNAQWGAEAIQNHTGRPTVELFPQGTELLEAALDRVFATGSVEEVEVATQPRGTSRWLRVHLAPVRGENNQITGALTIGEDVTQARQAGIELRMSVNALHRVVEARERLAADLHDGILQSLYGIGLRLEVARATADRQAADGHLAKAIRQLNDSMQEIRRSISDDRWNKPLDEKWEDTLSGLLRGLDIGGGPKLVVDIPREIARRVATADRPDLIFIAREAVSNAFRHAGARQILVRLSEVKERLRLEIIDDGKGFAEPRPAGLGLLTMTQRAGRIDAAFSVTSTPQRGTIVELEFAGKRP